VSLLLDTNVLSALARPEENPHVVAFLSRYAPADLFVSVITLGELGKGWHLLAEGRRKQALGEWILRTEREYAAHLLPVDVEVAYLWGKLTARAQQRGVVISTADGLIAATAVHHGLRIVTRNTRHFEASGAAVINPWAGS
jgi:predicted nucleic acid-binding protein